MTTLPGSVVHGYHPDCSHCLCQREDCFHHFVVQGAKTGLKRKCDECKQLSRSREGDGTPRSTTRTGGGSSRDQDEGRQQHNTCGFCGGDVGEKCKTWVVEAKTGKAAPQIHSTCSLAPKLDSRPPNTEKFTRSFAVGEAEKAAVLGKL
ncbi:unnamed protein product [Ectocarpus sp. 4 AP-2014]